MTNKQAKTVKEFYHVYFCQIKKKKGKLAPGLIPLFKGKQSMNGGLQCLTESANSFLGILDKSKFYRVLEAANSSS